MGDSFVSRFGCYTIIWDTTSITRVGSWSREVDVPVSVRANAVGQLVDGE